MTYTIVFFLFNIPFSCRNVFFSFSNVLYQEMAIKNSVYNFNFDIAALRSLASKSEIYIKKEY